MAEAIGFYIHSQTDENDLPKRYEDGARLLDQLEQSWQRKAELETGLRRLKVIVQTIQQQQQQNRAIPPEAAQYSQLLRDTYEKFMQANHEIHQLEQTVIKNLEMYVVSCEKANKIAIANLEEWKWQQKAGQYGKLIQNDVVALATKRYQYVMEHTFAAWRLLCRFHTLLNQNAQVRTEGTIENGIQILRHQMISLFERILKESFVITYQPPMVVKNKIRLELGLLSVIDKLGLETQPIQMSAKIISEETAAELKISPDEALAKKMLTVGHIDNASVKTKPLQRLSASTLGFELKNIKVTVESRKQATKSGEAIMKKYYFFCTTEIPFDNQIFKLSTLSLPFMVSVHGTQDVELYARAWWDMAFSTCLDSVPMIGESEIRWHIMAPALEAIFALLTKGHRRLTQRDVEYLKYRLFNGTPHENDPIIGWNQFYREKLDRIGGAMNEMRRKCVFSFWEWLFRIGDMIQDKSGRDTGVSEMWEERYIEGFISKQEAEYRLMQAHEPMMLIRFSDNQLAGLSIVCRSPYTNEIDHLIPFKFKEEIEKLTLPTMLVNCEQVKDIRIIYPDKPREQIEKMAIANKRVSEEVDHFGYRTRTLVIQSGEKSFNRSPSYSPSPSLLVRSSRDYNGIPMRYSVSPSRMSMVSNRVNNTYEFDLPDELMQMQGRDEQFDDIDDQMMQNILSNLKQTNEEDEMDAIVRLVQSFSADEQQQATNDRKISNAFDSSQMHFDFDM